MKTIFFISFTVNRHNIDTHSERAAVVISQKIIAE